MSKELIYQVMVKDVIEKFKPYVDYQACDLMTEMEVMEKNAKACACIAIDLVVKELDSIEQAERGCINGCWGQGDWKELKKQLLNE